MRRVFVRFGAGAVLACAITILLGAQEAILQLYPTGGDDSAQGASGSTFVDETPTHWFVELASPPTADGTSLSTVKQEKQAFRSNAAAAGLKFQERMSFDVLFNGLSVQVAKSDVARLARIPGVSAIYPVLPVTLSDTQVVDPSASPELATAITMTGADIAQNTLGLTGRGVKVAEMDTGIDYNHPDLGGCFGPGCRVAGGYDFVGDAYDSSNADPARQIPHPDNDPMDCAGHGTHVAGIIGAKAAEPGGVTGVAPGVTFNAYRVFGCSGTTDSDIMIAAMERALADGNDILSMSIGSDGQWPQYPTAAASDRLVNKGMVVVAAMGNNSGFGLYGTSAPASGKKVIGVASVDNITIPSKAFSIAPGNQLYGYSPATGAPVTPISGSYPMARTGTPTTTADGCTALAPGSLAGQIALIRRGTCSFYIKSMNAQNAGAAGVVLYNNVSGIVSPTVAGTPPVTIPVVAITAADGATINNLIAAGPTTLTWTPQSVRTPNATGGLISSFSSYGVAADLSLKPDISAPGGAIYSTYPLALGGYATLSGTSMATPHVSGTAALLLQAKPHTPPMAVRALLQNTSRPFAWWGNPALGFLDNVHRQGAGLVRIDDAATSPIKIEPSKLSLGESQAGPFTQTLTFTNGGTSDITLTLSNQDALATNQTVLEGPPGTFSYSIGFFTGSAGVAFSAPTVTVPAGSTATVSVTIAANSGWLDKTLYGGYLVATDTTSNHIYRVPYSGFKGDFQSIQVLAPTAYGFPWLAQLNSAGTSYIKQGNGAVYTMQGTDVPYVLAHFDQQSRMVRVDVFDINGKSWKRSLQLNYFGRNSSPTAFYAIDFDGTTFAGNRTYTVPNGQYYLVLSVLKALGDENNPADWETWTSPSFTIARP